MQLAEDAWEKALVSDLNSGKFFGTSTFCFRIFIKISITEGVINISRT